MKIASSEKLDRLEQLLNQYFMSTSYKIDRDTLKVTWKGGEEKKDIEVVKKGRRYLVRHKI